MKTSAYIAVSVDGFIAREDGRLDWLERAEPGQSPQPDPAAPTEDYGYHAFMESVDALALGRRTYEKARAFGGPWPYRNKRVVVLSRRPVDIPADLDHASWRNASPATLVEELESQGVQHLYVDGGETIRRFLVAGLLQQMIITRTPVLLGKGIPLFGPAIKADIHLRHLYTRAYPNGFAQSAYRVVQSGAG